MTVTVYSKPACVQCEATKRRLDKLDVAYTVKDITEDDKALDHVLKLGYKQVPVVETPTHHWGGYQPDLLAGLVATRGVA
jgi:glutaredoxin-like protein NrdH